MPEIIYKDEAYAVVGACFEMCSDKDCEFLEGVDQACLEIELELQGILLKSHEELQLTYKGRVLTHRYIPDFVWFDKIIVEIEAVTDLTDEHRAQVHNYLKATGFRLGPLVNFGSHGKLHYERIVR
jgi:GxxExxY protein